MEDYLNKVIQGDCLEVMKSMPDKSVDIVLTDPPYGIGTEHDFSIVRKALIEMRRISRMQMIILDWRNPLGIDDGKFAELVWEYGWISGGRKKSNHFYPTHNTVHFLGERFFSFESTGSILNRRPGFSSPRQCSYAKKTGHPYEKPLKLIEYLLIRSKLKGIVIDPFAGSGTTAVACMNLKRNFICIEKEPAYVKIINDRIGAVSKLLI